MARFTRRQFIKLGSSSAVAGAAVLGGLAPAREAQAGGALLEYPATRVGAARDLQVGTPVNFSYPDSDSPCVLLKLGHRVPGGVGPNADIVAYSALCTHMGCAVSYDAEAGTLKCPCHYSIFDPEKGGQQVCGQATENLPRIVLRHDEGDDSIVAVAVEGLLYGRQSNVL